MRPAGTRRWTLRRRLSSGPVDSRWWYWVAAVPLSFGLWVVTVAWLALALRLSPVAEANPVARAAEISMIAFGVPFFALVAVFPFAVYADASAVLEAGVGWRPPRLALTVAAAAGPVVAVVALLYTVGAGGGVALPLWAVALGFVVTVPVAAFYLHRRHQRLGVP